MRPIVIVAHGTLAGSLLATAQMIVGPAPTARSVDFEVGSSVEELQTRVAEAVAAVRGEGRALVLVDLAGGSPSRVAAALALEGGAVDVVTGANLPMLIHALTDASADVDALLQAGSDGIGRYGASAPSTGGLR